MQELSACSSPSIYHQSAAIQKRLDAGEEITFEEREIQRECQKYSIQWSKFIERRGRRYRNCKLANYEAKTAEQKSLLAKLSEYIDNMPNEVDEGRNIILFGPKGTGKDHCIMALARAAFMFGRSVAWRNGVALFSDLREAMSYDNPNSESGIANELTNAPVLWISDPVPPGGQLNEQQKAFFFRVIDARYSQMRPTWITVNVASGADAEQRLGAQSVDRLRECALQHFCNWKSRRGEA